MSLELLIVLAVAAFGLIVGSYLNVVIHRLPRGRSTVVSRSGCPFCGSLIHWWDNVPLLSFVWLRGACRACRSPISWRYPLVELATALLFTATWLAFGPGWPWILAALFGCLLLVLAAIDLEHLILPDRLTLGGTVLGLAAQRWLPWRGSFLDHLGGALVGAGILLAVYGAWYLLRRAEGLGLGDVKMMAMVGAFLGWRGALLTFMIGTFAAAGVAVTSMLFGRLGLENKLPFGPFLAFGAAVTMATMASDSLAVGAFALVSLVAP